MQGKLLTAEELAERLRTTKGHVANMRKRGQLPPPIRLPGLHYRWREEDIEKWIAQAAKRSGA